MEAWSKSRTFQNALLIDKYSILIRIVLRLAIVGPIDKK